MDYYEYLVKKLGEVISNCKCEFVIYPFGKLGVMTKSILNDLYAVQEKIIIDNMLRDGLKPIKSLKDITQEELAGCKILIASDNIHCYEELREQLYAVVKKEQCIELFPLPAAIKEYYRTKSEISKKMVDEGISGEKPIYYPQKTKSIFYLPLISRDCIQKNIFLTEDYYERSTLDKVFLFYEDGILKQKIAGGLVLDIGANIGNHTLYFCNECGAKKVYCFEPVDTTYSILKENIELNHLEQRVTLFPIGLGDTEGKAVSADYLSYNIGGTHLEQSVNGNIEVKRLDDLGIEEKIAFIKIDVEGMEGSVLRGGINLIRKNHPYIMLESFHNRFAQVEELLCKLGYKYECLDTSGNWLFYPEE